MKRRNFILTGGALASISLTITGTMASFVDSVSVLSGFHVVPREVSATLNTVPDSQNQPATHTWNVWDLYIETDVDTITVDYPDGTSLGGLDDKDITVELDRSGDGELTEVKVNKDTYTGSSATFDLAGNFNTNIAGQAKITINGIENPSSDVYMPAITYTTASDAATFETEMGISGSGAFFDPEITDAPAAVTAGNELTASYTVTNNGSDPGSRTVTVSAGTVEESTSVALEPAESYSDTFSYTTAADDAPAIDLVVETEDTTASKEVTITGAWNLRLDPAKQNAASTHSWSTGYVDYQGEVDTITVDYPGGSQGASLDGLTDEDVTVEITRSGESDPTEINVTSDSYSGSTAMFSLDGRYNTDIGGKVIVTIAGVENPKKGDYTADITLDGADETATDTVSFSI